MRIRSWPKTARSPASAAPRSRFTIAVNADDRNIEKKDKNLNEPIQFYSGKTPMLYEIVVNTEDKNQIKGYLSTPKNAPQQISMP